MKKSYKVKECWTNLLWHNWKENTKIYISEKINYKVKYKLRYIELNNIWRIITKYFKILFTLHKGKRYQFSKKFKYCFIKNYTK